MTTSRRHRRRALLTPIAAMLIALAACAPPVGGGQSTASGDSGPIPWLGDHAVVYPFCSAAGGPVTVTITGNTAPIRVSVAPDGEVRMPWAGGLDAVPAGGGTFVTAEPFPAGKCGVFLANLQLTGCGALCPGGGSAFHWNLTW